MSRDFQLMNKICGTMPFRVPALSHCLLWEGCPACPETECSTGKVECPAMDQSLKGNHRRKYSSSRASPRVAPCWSLVQIPTELGGRKEESD